MHSGLGSVAAHDCGCLVVELDLVGRDLGRFNLGRLVEGVKEICW